MPSSEIKILVIDDTEANRYIIRRHLESVSYKVYEASNGEEGLKLAEQLLPEIIILDVGLPDISGYEVCRLIKQQPWGNYLHIVQLSAAFVKDQDKALGLESGADSYLTHPIEPKYFLATINAIIRIQAAEYKLRKTTQVLTKTESELHAALKMRDEFLSIASHELRTPLTTLTLQVQMLLKYFKGNKLNDIPEEKIVKTVHTAEKQITNLSNLINTLFDTTLMGSGKLKLQRSQMDIVACIQEVLINMTNSLAQAGCEVKYISDNAAIYGQWDRLRVVQIVSNLLSNAIKYAAKNPIDVSVKRIDNMVSIVIQDHGKGIDIENQDKIFERFVCLNDSGSIGGLGLGLYIVKQIVEAHQGRIFVTSLPGKGAAFTVLLPCFSSE